jgi:hypothetical protein
MSELREFWITSYPNSEQKLAFDRPCHPDLKHLISEETHAREVSPNEITRAKLREALIEAVGKWNDNLPIWNISISDNARDFLLKELGL